MYYYLNLLCYWEIIVDTVMSLLKVIQTFSLSPVTPYDKGPEPQVEWVTAWVRDSVWHGPLTDVAGHLAWEPDRAGGQLPRVPTPVGAWLPAPVDDIAQHSRNTWSEQESN